LTALHCRSTYGVQLQMTYRQEYDLHGQRQATTCPRLPALLKYVPQALARMALQGAECQSVYEDSESGCCLDALCTRSFRDCSIRACFGRGGTTYTVVLVVGRRERVSPDVLFACSSPYVAW
jgi:hypothetical protein